MAMKVMLKEIEIKKNINSKNKQKKQLNLSVPFNNNKKNNYTWDTSLVLQYLQLYCNTLLLFTLVSSHFLFLIIPESQSFANYIAKRGIVLL